MKTAKLMRSVCQPKFTVSDEMISDVLNGVFAENKQLKCYMNCLLEMMQVMKKGKLSMEAAKKQVELLLPESYKPDYRNGMELCKNSADGLKDKCEMSFAAIKCLFHNNPKFIFP